LLIDDRLQEAINHGYQRYTQHRRFRTTDGVAIPVCFAHQISSLIEIDQSIYIVTDNDKDLNDDSCRDLSYNNELGGTLTPNIKNLKKLTTL